MKKFFNYILIALIVCLIIWGSFWLYEYSLKTQPVSAENGNVSGYAWSPNIGWISFSGSNYGVNIDSNGKFSGYVWSSSIGWISFNESDTGVPPSNDPCSDASCIAKATPSGNLGKSDVPIYGWARALTHGDGWDGWIRFDHGQANNEVYIDANGEFHDWAWGGDVIGWISFNCTDASDIYPFTCESEGGDICQVNENCPGEIWDVISTDCCSVTCVLKNCAEQGGDICEANENCPGTIIPARDTDSCCSATCEIIIIEPTLEICLDDCDEDLDWCIAGCKWWQIGCEEDCDDEYSICVTDCEDLYCGNGEIDSGEQCDDANTSNTDACLNTCVNATCGDGYTWAGVEQCDDGNTSNTDACLNTCVNATCGDGYAWAGVEECDDGNTNSGDGCSATCTIEHTLETCLDDCIGLWPLAERIACKQDCRDLYCGNCVIDSGGAYPLFNEQCDDCNVSNTDACLNTCKNASCGDGYRWSGVEQCDDGNTSNTDACLNTCVNATCGDGYRWSGVEQCDDGNNVNGDGCSATCTIEEDEPEEEEDEPEWEE